ncbi:sigma-70 family RNA polymerase sigma factor [Streptomyces sp. NPDC096153]|uniref:sigma-70 family RNA polymerase sigma factor n=1 Tax=Streptomyces sp. NPDC096153 TaxID=3155548 RepID=UPI003321888E
MPREKGQTAMNENREASCPDSDFGHIYSTHSGQMYRYALRALRDPHHAEDAVQEAFFRAWNKWHRFDPARGNVRAWLFTVLSHIIIDNSRAAKVRPPLQSDQSGREMPTQEEIERLLSSQVIKEALRRLKEEHRVILVESYYRGRTYADIAADLCIPTSTARTRAFYGLRALRVALMDIGWES